MPVFQGEVKLLSECSAGDLIRLPHRGLGTFAFATRGPNGADVTKYVAFNGIECGAVFDPDDDPLVLSYGRSYRIEPASDAAGAVIVGGGFDQGRIVCNRPRNGSPASTHLMCLNQRGNAQFYDMEAGTLHSAPGGDKIDVPIWELFVTGRPEAVFRFG